MSWRKFAGRQEPGGDDEEREKKGESTSKDLTEYTRANLLYMRVGNHVFRAPFHAGPFSTIKYAGNCAARMMLLKMSPADVLKDVGGEALGVALSMVGGGNINIQSQRGTFADDAKTAIGTAVPTIIQPIVQGGFNVDYAGRSIRNEGFPNDTTPDSYHGRKGTGEGYKAAAKWLNDATAADGKEKGYVDLHPEVLKLAGEVVGKNVLRDVMNVGSSFLMLFGDEPFAVRNIPVARDLVRRIPDNDARYNKARKDYEEHLAYFKKNASKMTPAERSDFRKRHFGRADFDDDNKKNRDNLITSIRRYRKMEMGFTYASGKPTPKEWSNAEIEGFRKKRLKLQAQFLEWVGE